MQLIDEPEPMLREGKRGFGLIVAPRQTIGGAGLRDACETHALKQSAAVRRERVDAVGRRGPGPLFGSRTHRSPPALAPCCSRACTSSSESCSSSASNASKSCSLSGGA